MNLCLIDPFKQSDVPEAVDHYLVDPKNIKSNCAQFNRRGTLLAVGCGSPMGKILVWDFATSKIVRTLYHHSACVNSISWSRNGKKLLTSSNDNTLVLWDLPTSTLEYKLNLSVPVIFAEFHPRDNNICIIQPKGLDPILLDFKNNVQKKITLKEFAGNDYKGQGIYASFSRKGERIFIGDGCSTISVINYKTMTLEKQFKIASSSTVRINQIEFSRNNRFMLVSSSDRIIRLYSLEPTNLYGFLREYQDSVNRLHWKKCCFSSNNEYVVAGMASKSVHSIFIWSVISGSLVKDLEGPKEGFVDVVWHPLRPILVSISDTGVCYVWTAYFEENWSSFAPDFQELEENLEYVEEEDEFDVREEDEDDDTTNNDGPTKKKIKTQKQLQELSDLNEQEQENFVDVDNNDRITEFSSDEEEDLFFFSTVNDKYLSNVQFDDYRHPLYEKYTNGGNNNDKNNNENNSTNKNNSSNGSTTTEDYNKSNGNGKDTVSVDNSKKSNTSSTTSSSSSKGDKKESSSTSKKSSGTKDRNRDKK